MLYEDSVYKTRIWDLHFQVSSKNLKTLGLPCCSKFSSAPWKEDKITLYTKWLLDPLESWQEKIT